MVSKEALNFEKNKLCMNLWGPISYSLNIIIAMTVFALIGRGQKFPYSYIRVPTGFDSQVTAVIYFSSYLLALSAKGELLGSVNVLWVWSTICFKLLLYNYTNFNRTLQECSLGDPLPKITKRNVIRHTYSTPKATRRCCLLR